MNEEEDLGFDETEELGEHDLLVLEQADGTRVECIVLAIVEHEGREYALLSPRTGAHDDEDDEEDDVLVATWDEADDGSLQVGPVEDDGVLDALSSILENLIGMGPSAMVRPDPFPRTVGEA